MNILTRLIIIYTTDLIYKDTIKLDILLSWQQAIPFPFLIHSFICYLKIQGNGGKPDMNSYPVPMTLSYIIFKTEPVQIIQDLGLTFQGHCISERLLASYPSLTVTRELSCSIYNQKPDNFKIPFPYELKWDNNIVYVF